MHILSILRQDQSRTLHIEIAHPRRDIRHPRRHDDGMAVHPGSAMDRHRILLHDPSATGLTSVCLLSRAPTAQLEAPPKRYARVRQELAK